MKLVATLIKEVIIKSQNKNNMKNKCIIVIPIYKENPNIVERASFSQVLTILKSHDICIYTHKECNLSIYKQISDNVEKVYSVELFDKQFFKSIDGYNDLCYSKDFYLRFNSYKYMLIYQLDAWVFRDELLYWCDKDYDYIGAPIFYAYNKSNFTTKFMGIGNGGFCLRKISHCLNVLNSNHKTPFINPRNLIKMYWNFMLYNEKFKPLTQKIRIIPTVFLKAIGVNNNLNYFIKNHLNEDMIFGTWSSVAWGKHGKVPSKEEAMKFSFEVHPQLLYNENKNTLPFGCHAFEKWEFKSFWSNYIKIE